ncbi:hypothetical protein LCGC14_2154880, partial [marine sediment metagenome]
VETLIIAFYVIIVDLVLKAYWPEMSRSLGPYVGLIITNCIVMGRCEAFAGVNHPVETSPGPTPGIPASRHGRLSTYAGAPSSFCAINP